MSRRPALRFRTAAVTAALSATALVGGGFAVALTSGSPADSGIALTQQKLDSTMTVGQPVDVDLKAVAAKAAGGQIPDGAALTVTGLPEGVVQDGWHLTGTPTRAGTYDVLVTFEVAGQTAAQTVPLTVREAGAAAAATTAASPAVESGVEPTETETTGTETTGTDTTGTTGTETTAATTTAATTTAAPATTTTAAPGQNPAAEPAATTTTAASTSPTFAAQTRCSTAGGSVDPAALIGAAGPALGIKGEQSVLAGILATIVEYLPQLMGQNAGSLNCATPATTGATATTAGTLAGGAATTSPATSTPAAGPAGDLLAIVGPLLGVDTSSLGAR